MIFRSRFVFPGTDFALRLAARPFGRRVPSVGGGKIAAGGAQASHVIRRDHLAEVTLRLFEEEWPLLYAMIAYGQSSGIIEWYPDADIGVSYNVYLHSPMAGTDIETTLSEFPGMEETTIIFRNTSGSVWDLRYFRVGV